MLSIYMKVTPCPPPLSLSLGRAYKGKEGREGRELRGGRGGRGEREKGVFEGGGLHL